MVDFKRAQDIMDALSQPIDMSPQNDLLHRMKRNIQRTTSTANKASEKRKMNESEAEMAEQIAIEKQSRKDSSEREKILKDQLNTLRGKGVAKKGNRPHVVADGGAGSSSGRVKVITTTSKARAKANPYPACKSLPTIHLSLYD